MADPAFYVDDVSILIGLVKHHLMELRMPTNTSDGMIVGLCRCRKQLILENGREDTLVLAWAKHVVEELDPRQDRSL